MESEVIGGHEGGDDVWRVRNKGGVTEKEKGGRINTSISLSMYREGDGG